MARVGRPGRRSRCGGTRGVFLRELEARPRQRRHAAVVVRRARRVDVANGPQVNVAG